MKVAELQQHLADLARLLKGAEVKKEIVDDLNAIRDGLAPFRELPLKGFAEFLTRAEAYRRGGEVPVEQPKGGQKKPTPKANAKVAPDIAALTRDVQQLYDHAADPSTTEASIDAVLARLGPVDKKGLVTIAEAIELKVGSKTKPAIVGTIRQRIIERKGSSQRVGLLDRPAPIQADLPEPSLQQPHISAIQSQDGSAGNR